MHEKSSTKSGAAGDLPGGLNRYAPPQAPVADAPVLDLRGRRPAWVAWAVGMLWSYLALEAVEATANVREMMTEGLWRLGGFTAVCLAVLGGEAWVIYQISLGKRWARAIALAWFILRVCTDVVCSWKQISGLTLVWAVLETASMAAALCLLFLTPGRRWYAD